MGFCNNKKGQKQRKMTGKKWFCREKEGNISTSKKIEKKSLKKP